ncbi:aldo/keto reductase [Paenibacillus eucommiae]|uniref:Aryl-alcohol dehydrogenase-like predicted oxidoreductase n=1 Tax=Paenibacillus eucommiae TaxID=1355755 RepID=A0ABS4J3T5_9BACL|nr:aldo/keto reductase [Paenibacillus eucommiae]MBP1994505.1 aryl-alcohol dehydrogenase-like predicted oxidoreductase [Paenibacillus eucommiae]
MILKMIPATNLHASVICLGTAPFGSSINETESFKLLDSFVNAGGNFIDTSLNYADWACEIKGISEKTIGKWLKTRKNRGDIIVGTKGACPSTDPRYFFRLSREDILSDLEQSLRNLETDVIDLYWLHRDDPTKPVEGIIDVLDEQVRAGKIRFFACSNWTTKRIEEARLYAVNHGKHQFCASQIMWSLAEPNQAVFLSDPTIVSMDDKTRHYHEQKNLAVVPYSSQANGFFSGQYRKDELPNKPAIVENYFNDLNFDRLDRVMELSRQLDKPPSVISLAYLSSSQHGFPVFPIIGASNIKQLEESCLAGDVILDASAVRYLEM